jgi:uncharacterized iron-regulated membrane protein
MTRGTLLKWHRWAGLIFGVLLLIQGLTGTLLVFRDEIDQLVFPELTVPRVANPIPIEQLTQAVTAARPGAQLQRIEFPAVATQAAIFRLKDADGEPAILAADVGTGTVVRQGGLSSWPSEWVFHLHDQLLAGKVGDWIVGIEGIVLVFMLITGPIVWWPGRKRLKSGFRVIADSGTDRLVRTLHRSAGAILAVGLLVSSFTGVFMIFKADLAPALGTVTKVVPKPSPKVEVREGVAYRPLDMIVASARASHGATPLRELRFTGKAGQVVAVYLQDEGSLRVNATKQIHFNRYTGAELGSYVPSTLPAGSNFFDWLFPIHTGQAIGLTGRLLILCHGLGLVFFAASGIWLWISARNKKRAAQAKRAARMTAEMA